MMKFCGVCLYCTEYIIFLIKIVINSHYILDFPVGDTQIFLSIHKILMLGTSHLANTDHQICMKHE